MSFSYSLILGLESDLVRVAVVTGEHVLYEAKTPLSTYVDASTKVKGSGYTDSLLRAIRDALKALDNHPFRGGFDEVHYICSSPWILSKVMSMSMLHDKEVPVTQKSIQTFIDDSLKANGLNNARTIVEQKIFEIKLDGYEVQEVKNQKAKKVAISLATSILPENLVVDLPATVKGIVHVKKEYFHSALLLQYAASRSFYTDNYIFIHIHGRISDVVVVRDGVCNVLASLPFGSRTFVHKVAQTLGMSEPLARSAINLVGDKVLHRAEEDKVTKAINAGLAEWFTALASAIGPSFKGKVYISASAYGASFEQHLKASKPDLFVASDPHSTIELYRIALGHLNNSY